VSVQRAHDAAGVYCTVVWMDDKDSELKINLRVSANHKSLGLRGDVRVLAFYSLGSSVCLSVCLSLQEIDR
jgi:hypothetical protein